MNANKIFSRKIINTALENNCGIKLEDLKGIRKRKNEKTQQSFKYSLNSWSFYQLRDMVEYKSRILGIPVTYIDPHYTSQKCSRCGLIGIRSGKKFRCVNCGHVDHADSNAAFNIAAFEFSEQSSSNDQLVLDRDNTKRNTDILRVESQIPNGNEVFAN